MSEYPTSAAVQDLSARIDQLTFEVAFIGNCLNRIADALTNPAATVEPGPCWHDSGVNIPTSDVNYRCELKAGHLGAHECERGNGSAVWPA